MTAMTQTKGKKRRLSDRFDLEVLVGFGRLAVLGLLVLIMALISENFFTIDNFSNIVANASIMIILGIGLTIAIVTAGPDLSVGSVLTITSVVAAILVKREGMFFLSGMFIALGVGALFGLLNGFMIAKIGIPSFISTYGLQWAVFGFAYVLLKGYVVYDFAENFRFIGNGYLFGIPMPIIMMLITFIIFSFVLKKTTLGRSFYAVGANREAAEMSGIKTQRTIIIAYVISGTLAALGGLVLIARVNAVEATIGSAFLLPTIATVYMGGTSSFGGKGTLLGTVIGALLMAIVQNGMNLLGVPAVWRDAVVGLLIIVTVLTDLSIRKALDK